MCHLHTHLSNDLDVRGLACRQLASTGKSPGGQHSILESLPALETVHVAGRDHLLALGFSLR